MDCEGDDADVVFLGVTEALVDFLTTIAGCSSSSSLTTSSSAENSAAAAAWAPFVDFVEVLDRVDTRFTGSGVTMTGSSCPFCGSSPSTLSLVSFSRSKIASFFLYNVLVESAIEKISGFENDFLKL